MIVIRKIAFKIKILQIFAVFSTLILLAPVHAAQFEIGDILYREGITGWENINPWGNHVGHAGIFIGYMDNEPSAMVIESVPNSEDPPGVRKVRWVDFVSGLPYYGNRTTDPEPIAEQRSKICEYAKNRVGLPYDTTHLNQKGPLEFDCVGLTELVYELVGLNPTPDSFETGVGWPLTPTEQYNHTFQTVSQNPLVILKDSHNIEIADGETTADQNLKVYVTDQEHGSGLKLFKVLKDDPFFGQEIMRDETQYEYDQGDFIDISGTVWKTYNLPIFLPVGTYYIHSFDRAGNDVLYHFTVDITPPGVTDLDVQPDPADINPTLTALATDALTNITAAEYYLDGSNPPPGGGIALIADDGSFDELSEDITGTIDISGLSIGNHTTYVRAMDAAGNWSPSVSHDFSISSTTAFFTISIDPPVGHILPGQILTHTVSITNSLDSDVIFNLSTDPIAGNYGGWIVGSLADPMLTVVAKSTGTTTFTVANQGAASDITIKVIASANGTTSSGTAYSWQENTSINDHPDETYDISDPKYPTKWLVDTESPIGILLGGWSDGLGHLLGKYGIRTSLVKNDLTLINSKKSLNDLKVLLIGSASLAGLNQSSVFKQKLANFVTQGGTIICLTQQHGYEFETLPGGISGYGWLEDQSCHSKAVYIDKYHQVLSGQSNYYLDVDVDGYFTKYPSNATVLMSRTVNGQPAMV